MVATIEQELKASRNVIGMLERFRGNAGETLTGELDILLADMRSSNYEAALTRFEARLNSPHALGCGKGADRRAAGGMTAQYISRCWPMISSRWNCRG